MNSKDIFQIKKSPNRQITFVTHLNPDLDSSLALWLLWKFVFVPHKKSIIFVPVGEKIEKQDKTYIHVDTGGKDFDHHQSKEYECSASLVMKVCGLNKDNIIVRMVDFTLLADHGKLYDYEIEDFNLLNVISGLNKKYKDNPSFVIETLFICYDAIYSSLTETREAEKAFVGGIEFDTRWGKGIGFNSRNPRLRNIAYKRGFELFVFLDHTTGYAGFALKGTSTKDISAIYETLRKIEPNADWFLHSSHQLVLCGSAKAPNKNTTKLSLQELIEIASRN